MIIFFSLLQISNNATSTHTIDINYCLPLATSKDYNKIQNLSN